jgi:hypothetical protein
MKLGAGVRQRAGGDVDERDGAEEVGCEEECGELSVREREGGERWEVGGEWWEVKDGRIGLLTCVFCATSPIPTT